MRLDRLISFGVLLGFLLVLGCIDTQNHASKNEQTNNGKDVITQLDALFTRLGKLKEDSADFPETVVETNEKIRRTIENIHSTQSLDEIASAYASGQHDFTYVLSGDGKMAVFSWYTRMDTYGNGIKNIALYSTGKKLIPNSLYGTPMTYGRIHQITSTVGTTIYILVGQKQTKNNFHYLLGSYMIRNDHLEEAPIFPNNESLLSFEQPIENQGIDIQLDDLKILLSNFSNTLSQQYSLAFDGKKYIMEQSND